jgi:hypothetical protein
MTTNPLLSGVKFGDRRNRMKINQNGVIKDSRIW